MQPFAKKYYYFYIDFKAKFGFLSYIELMILL